MFAETIIWIARNLIVANVGSAGGGCILNHYVNRVIQIQLQDTTNFSPLLRKPVLPL